MTCDSNFLFKVTRGRVQKYNNRRADATDAFVLFFKVGVLIFCISISRTYFGDPNMVQLLMEIILLQSNRYWYWCWHWYYSNHDGEWKLVSIFHFQIWSSRISCDAFAGRSGSQGEKDVLWEFDFLFPNRLFFPKGFTVNQMSFSVMPKW